MRRIIRNISTLIILALVLVSCITAPVLADGETTISISAPDEVTPGSSFTVTIDITGVEDLNAVQYDISFDPSVIRLDSVSDGQINSIAISAMSNKIGEGHWRVVQSMGLGKISGSGCLATLHFRAVGTGGANSGIDITNGLLADFDMNAIQATWGTKSVSVISGESGDQSSMTDSTQSSTTDSTPGSTPSSSPSSSPPPSTEQETGDESAVGSGTVAEVQSPAPLLPPAPGSGKKPAAAPAPATRDTVTELDETPAQLLPPAPESQPVSQPWLWIVVGGVIVIIVLFIVIRLSRRPF